MNQTFMKEKPVFSLVVSMSLPMVLSMLVNSLYNIIDSYFVAKISEDAMTALSLVYPLQNLVNAVGVGFGIGINAAVAYFLGAQKKDKANDAASQGMLFSILHGIALTIGCMACLSGFLRIFTDSRDVLAYGLQYGYIVSAFSVVISAAITFEKFFQAMGMMVVSMVSMMCGCIANIVLDPIMIFGLGPVPEMGIVGAAFATGIGQVVSLVIYIVIYLIKPLPVRFEFRRQKQAEKLWKRLYGVGIPAALNMALASFLITGLNGILSVYSQMYVLILGIYYKLQTFIYLTANGIVQGIRPLVAYNYGAKEYGRVSKIYRTALGLAVGVMAVGMILCLIIPGQLIGMFTENADTIQAGSKALRIICCGFIVSAVSVTSCGTLEGLGKGIPSLCVSMMRYLIVILPLAWVLSRIAGPMGVWHTFWITESIVAVVAWVIYRHCCRRDFTEQNE